MSPQAPLPQTSTAPGSGVDDPEAVHKQEQPLQLSGSTRKASASSSRSRAGTISRANVSASYANGAGRVICQVLS